MEDAAPDRAGGRRRTRRLAFLLGCALLAVLKLWLVSEDEIVARVNSHDQQRYAEMADALVEGRWFGAYHHLALIRGPSYPLWLGLVRVSGAPLRVAAEGLLIAAALLFAGTLIRLGVPPGLGLASFASIVLQPHSLLVNREVLPAGFYLPVLLCGMSGLLLAAAAPGPGRTAAHGAWAGLALGVLWSTRPETPLVAVALAVFALFELLARRGWGASWGRSLARAGALAAIPACGIAVVASTLSAVNRHHYGVSTLTDLAAPGFAAANRALLSIEHDAPRRYVPVPAEVRERAYAASPALRELAPYLEAPGWARNASCNTVGVCDDLAGGWFLWALREAAARAGHMGSAPEGEAFFRRIADELESACARDALPCRRPLLNFLHPHPSTYLPHLWRSFRRIAQRIATSGRTEDRDPPRDPPSTPPAVRRLYDRVANRRQALTSNGWVTVEGWASAPGDPIERVVLGKRRGRRRELASEGSARAAPEAAAGPDRVRFRFRLEKSTREFRTGAPVLEIRRASGARVVLPLPEPGERVEREGVRVAVERLSETPVGDAAQRRVRAVLWRVHSWWVRGLTAGGLAAAVALLIPPWRGRFAAPVCGALVLIAAVVVGRVAVFTLIDASSFAGRSSRYLYPVISLYGVGMLLLIREAAGRVARAARSLTQD